MSIKINEKILSIPPYISTSWSNITALHMKGGVLVVTLKDADTLHIPGLSSDQIHSIFQYHAAYLEKEQFSLTNRNEELAKFKRFMEQTEEPAIRLAFGSSLEGLNTFTQHNPAQADAPDLPVEVLQKISAIAKIIAPADELILPRAELGCNCFHCQIARVLNPITVSLVEEQEEEEVSLEELQFQQWAITQTGDHLFSVTNRLDENEKYNVYLGHPVGCTCGEEGCDHILAVLKS